MILHLDTSAYIRLYVREEGHEFAWQASQEAQQIAVHLIAYAEMRAALAKMLRMNRLTRREITATKKAFESDWDKTLHIVPDKRMMRRAGDLAEHYNLRGYDNAHLAAAESLIIGHGSSFLPFASFDHALNARASAVGLHLLAAD